jgi:hypothetical protein
MQRYTIWAYSPSQHQTQHQINLDAMPADATDAQAQQRADAFAHALNTQQHLTARDWEGVWRLEEVGYHTLPGYAGHDPNQ